VRRFTLIALLVLLALIVAAAIYQVLLAGRHTPRYPGPVPGTPLPSASPR
jgi:hypothetical protein